MNTGIIRAMAAPAGGDRRRPGAPAATMSSFVQWDLRVLGQIGDHHWSWLLFTLVVRS